MIQFDDSGSNSILLNPLQHASKHAPTQANVTESEEEIKTQEQQPLNPPGPSRERSTSGSTIIYEDSLINKTKKYKKDTLMEKKKTVYESSTNSDSGDSSNSSSTSEANEDHEINTSENDSESESSENDNNKRGTIKRKQRMPKAEVKKRKKVTKPQKKKKPNSKKRKTNNTKRRDTSVYNKTKKLIEKALKDLKKIK